MIQSGALPARIAQPRSVRAVPSAHLMSASGQYTRRRTAVVSAGAQRASEQSMAATHSAASPRTAAGCGDAIRSGSSAGACGLATQHASLCRAVPSQAATHGAFRRRRAADSGARRARRCLCFAISRSSVTGPRRRVVRARRASAQRDGSNCDGRAHRDALGGRVAAWRG